MKELDILRPQAVDCGHTTIRHHEANGGFSRGGARLPEHQHWSALVGRL